MILLRTATIGNYGSDTSVTMTRRQNKDIDPAKYIKIRLKMLRDERAKNMDPHSHLILDKSIDELSIVLDLIKRTTPKTPL